MKDFASLGPTPARHAVSLFAASPLEVPAREDVEIAASLVCGDGPALMELFDAACQVRAFAGGREGDVMLGTSFSKVRAFAAERIESEDVPTLERNVGGQLSHECYRRLRASGEDAALRRHHMASAADHYAADVIDALSSLIGRPADGTSFKAAPGYDPSAIRDMPFICFLGPAVTEGFDA
ncbi:hypothetical protein GOB57_08860 [Sinorhizobium meliloti]|nr:hypothetical protein [Sinorhizobium meliloti]